MTIFGDTASPVRDSVVGSVVLERMRGCSFIAALLLAAATAASLLDEVGFRSNPGRVTFWPFAVRVVVDPSGFLTYTTEWRPGEETVKLTRMVPAADFFFAILGVSTSSAFGGTMSRSQTIQ